MTDEHQKHKHLHWKIIIICALIISAIYFAGVYENRFARARCKSYYPTDFNKRIYCSASEVCSRDCKAQQLDIAAITNGHCFCKQNGSEQPEKIW